MRSLLRTGVVLSTMLVGVASPGALRAEAPADLVLRNGRFYPVSQPGAVEGSLAIRGGRIAYLGPDEGLGPWIGGSTRQIDLAGRTVTPGLIDAHSHLLNLGGALSSVDLVGTTSYEEVVERTLAFAAGLPAGAWILGRGWDQNDWPTDGFPEHGLLSRAVPQNPVWLGRIDGHAALLNAAAMEELGVDDSLADPPGGRVLRDAAGHPTGVLVDAAMGLVGGRIPRPGRAELERRLSAAAGHCLATGLTTVTDMGVGQGEYEAYRALRDRDELTVRAALFLTDDAELLDRFFARGPVLDPDQRLTVRGVKLYMDGALGSRGAALIEPYSDDPGNLGLLQTSEDHLEAVCKRALATGFQVATHAIGDRGNLLVLDGYERCFAGAPRPEARFRIEHAQVMRPADIERMARLGVIASMQPTHATSDMPWAGRRVGARRIEGAYAWRKVLSAGGRLALGSDFPVESADPRLGLYAAVTRQDLEGFPAGGWQPAERLTREEALRGFTLDAAYSLFLEDEVGSLEVGKRADLVVFERDILRVPAPEIPTVAIDWTLVDGQVAFQREGAR
jgi:predicted amidohydrolase YtcJ